jgi:phosphatidylinositol glycan class V
MLPLTLSRNVGPFRYWTISNLPLFALAIPTLAWLVVSAVDVMGIPTLSPARKSTTTTALSRQENAAMALALPQLLLAILAFTSYHVQIITRLASGYPIAYIWLASETVKSPVRASSIVRWMVMYALIQAGLYASFLPPA